MSEPAHDDFPPTVDLTGIPLDQVARLCEATAGKLSPQDASDRPVLRRALHRVIAAATRPGETFAGHGESPPTSSPPTR